LKTILLCPSIINKLILTTCQVSPKVPILSVLCEILLFDWLSLIWSICADFLPFPPSSFGAWRSSCMIASYLGQRFWFLILMWWFLDLVLIQFLISFVLSQPVLMLPLIMYLLVISKQSKMKEIIFMWLYFGLYGFQPTLLIMKILISLVKIWLSLVFVYNEHYKDKIQLLVVIHYSMRFNFLLYTYIIFLTLLSI